MGLPALRADLLLLHAPAVFEFRDRRDMYFPFLGTSGDVPITPLYEYFPVGFKSLQRYLGERGHDVAIINLTSLLIRYRHLDLATIFAALDTRVVGIDLHWMIHVQGSLAVASELKRLRPDIKVMLGGISATYYAAELIRYDFIDYVMQGYDTHEPVHQLMERLAGGGPLGDVPNLMWKDHGEVVDNGMAFVPASFSCGIDWSIQTERPTGLKSLPILEFLSTQNAGCSYNCDWCGGSREAFRRIYRKKKAMARKPRGEIEFEFQSLRGVDNLDRYHFYSVGSYNEGRAGMMHFLDLVEDTPLKSISYEQFHLTPDDVLKKMARANKNTSITLSPESHDPRIARLSGRGVYTNQEMEDWLERALDHGIAQIDIWYFIGMPEQDARSAMESVEYCEHLLRKFQGTRVNPMVCPMIPFLDPASTIFESPEEHGYKVFFRTAEEHRRGMESASIINRTNYETDWLSRRDLLFTGYQAIRRLMEAKAEHGFIPSSYVRDYIAKIDDAAEFVPEVHEADCIEDPAARSRALEALGDEIQRRNEMIIFHGVANQAFPINRKIGGRWFDEFGWPLRDLDATTLAEETSGAGAD